MSVALRLTGLRKSYGAVTALNGLSIEVAEGRFFALFGPSSVGKTTALRTIAGLVAPEAGSVEIAGRDVTRAPIKGRGVAMVFQSFALYPHLTVEQNLGYPLTEAGVASAEIAKRARETAEMLRLAHRLDKKPGTLSGGEQQRLALGRALIARPKLLLLDEPLTNLDAKLRHDMRAELKRLHRQFGMTIVYATPDELEALSMGEEIAVMDQGAVVQVGTPDELYDRPRNTYVAAKIGSPHMNLFDAVVAQGLLRTPFGDIPLPGNLAVAPGERVTAGIRPSDLRVDGARPTLTPHVQLLEPLGDVTIVSLATGGPVLRLLLPEGQASGLKLGDPMPITIPPARVHLFRGGDGSAIAAGA